VARIGATSFSEYIEGSSNNKALEIYNGTGTEIDLSAGAYSIQMYFNGSTSAGLTINLTGIVANGDVYVVAHSSADAAILAQADQTNGASWYNGDDAVILRKGSTIIDAIGQIGFDPGTQWGSELISTADNTLRRKSSICTGDPDGNNPFDPSIEWEGYATNTFEGLGAHTVSCDLGPLEPKINEFSASTTSTDVEYVEIFGDPNTDYSAYTVLEIEGDGSGAGYIDEVISIGTTDANGFGLISLSDGDLENGTITLLLVENFTGGLGVDLDTDNDGAFDATPWSTIVDSVAVNDGGVDDRFYGEPVLGPNYDGISYYAPGGASRIPDGYDTDAVTDWVRNDFDLGGIESYPGSLVVGEAYNTPGAPNMVYETPPLSDICYDPYTKIYEIQGNGLESPLDGTEVVTEGIVVGDFQEVGLKGFHIQDEIGDGNPATSDGIFVYYTGLDVNVGDYVRVRGNVDEYYGLTEITNVGQAQVCDTDFGISPTTISLPVNTIDEFEPIEGMLVTFPQNLIISEYFNFDRYGEIVLTSNRHLTPTALYDPGTPEQSAAAEAYLLDHIILDDGRTVQNPDPAIHPNGANFDLYNLFRGGDTVANITGIMDYAFGEYRIQLTQGADYTNANPRPIDPNEVGGDIKVASFNVLNYFTTLGSRGADTSEEFDRQRTKIINAIATINADVVGLMEIENNDAAVSDLVTGLNDLMGAGTYDYVDTGTIGTDEIKVAMIYKPSTVNLIGSYAILDSSVDPRFLDEYNRPTLAHSFMDNTNGGVFTVAVNHLKSKGSDCIDVGDPDLGDGAGNCNLTRKYASQALVDWLASDPTGSGSNNYLIIGDLNSYDKEDPIDAILAGPDDLSDTEDDYIDLIFDFLGENAYTYVFDGQIGYLDHALANMDLLSSVKGTTVWHINADEPDLIDYDMSFKQDAQDALYAPDPFRSSDHDPVIVGLAVADNIAPTIEITVTPDAIWPPNHKYVEVEVSVITTDNFDQNPTVTLLSVTSNEPDNGEDDGNTVDDIVIIDDYHFQLRAERSDLGNGRIYTITYLVSDANGNETIQSATVLVPLNQGN